jgi:hypothetical protein
MLDPYRGDVLFRVILDERLRDSRQVRLLSDPERRPGIGSSALDAIGGLLVWTGTRLQRVARSSAPGKISEPCFDCPN